jgi:hypothetical protein
MYEVPRAGAGYMAHVQDALHTEAEAYPLIEFMIPSQKRKKKTAHESPPICVKLRHSRISAPFQFLSSIPNPDQTAAGHLLLPHPPLLLRWLRRLLIPRISVASMIFFSPNT